MNTIIPIVLLISLPIIAYPFLQDSLQSKHPKLPPVHTRPSTTRPSTTTPSTTTPFLQPENGCEVYPNIYLGNYLFASDKNLLIGLGITHIVNAAKEIPNYFKDEPEVIFQYIHLNMDDIPQENASRFFEISRKFISNAVKGGGKVLIHCRAGISRSATILMYYLMKTIGISAQQALNLIRQCRPIANPNPGFLKQIGYLKNSL
jgi:Dual specificity phosphatase, catalytic domain